MLFIVIILCIIIFSSIKMALNDSENEYKCSISQKYKDECKRKRQYKVNTISQKANNEDFVKEQRNKMKRIYKDGLTLRDWILRRDNYTCQKCGASLQNEPHLLLEVDHIHPVSRGGESTPKNLETLCWCCNREKSNKES